MNVPLSLEQALQTRVMSYGSCLKKGGHVSGGQREGGKGEERRQEWRRWHGKSKKRNKRLRSESFICFLLHWGATFVTPIDLIIDVHLSLIFQHQFIIISPSNFNWCITLAPSLTGFRSLELGQFLNKWQTLSETGTRLRILAESWGWGKGSAFQLGWSAWLLDDSTEYISPGDFPAADCWVQLEAYMSSHFIIFIHLGAQVFALAGCSWLAVNSQLLFSWNPQLKLWANMTGNQIGTWIKMFRISERCLVFICFNQVKPTHLGKRIGGEPETHPDTFAKARLARKPVFSQWWVKFNTCHPIRHFSGFSYFPRI